MLVIGYYVWILCFLIGISDLDVTSVGFVGTCREDGFSLRIWWLVLGVDCLLAVWGFRWFGFFARVWWFSVVSMVVWVLCWCFLG